MRRYAAVLMPFLILASMCASRAVAQRLPNAVVPAKEVPGRIRGVVFDSLLMKPIAHATVTLLDRAIDVMSDDRGRFAFNDVPVGEHTVIFTTPETDSLGFGTLGAPVVLRSGEVALMTLATPSTRTLWQRLCSQANRVGTDSGIVWGTVRDASTGATLNGAVTMFKWYELKPGKGKLLSVTDTRREVTAGTAGVYIACGLPADVRIASLATATASASGTIEYAIGDRRLHHLNLVVSTDMVLPDSVKLGTAADSAKWLRARGTATVKGTVLNEKGRPQSDALVTVSDADTTVRTNKIGEFIIGGLPAGTQLLQAKQVGSAPIEHLVDLHPDSITVVTLKLSDAKLLSVFNVRATKTIGVDRREFEQRRKTGFGYALDEKELANRIDVAGALRTLPGLQVSHAGFDLQLSMRGTFKGRCSPTIFLDGMPSDVQIIEMRNPSDFRAIELFSSANVPAQYMSRNTCGTLLFWSRNARW